MLAAWWGSPVYGHASLLGVEPGDGSVVLESPAQVRLLFNEPVVLTQVQLRPAAGNPLTLPLSQDRQTEHQLPLPDLSEGVYWVSWRAISLDSHPISGSWIFRVGPGELPSTSTPSQDPVTWAVIGVRWGLYVSTLLVVGLGLARATGPAADWQWGAVWLCFSLSWVALALQAAQLQSLAAVLTSPFGGAILGRLLGASLVIAGIPGGIWLLVLSFVPLGHSLTSPVPALTMALLGLHLLGVGFWLGGLVQIERGWLDLEGMQRFSRRATWIVPGLVAAGLGMAWIHRGWAQGWDHPYGLWLSGKVILTLLLLALAAHNKFRLLPALRTAPRTGEALRRSVRLELLGIGLVFALSSLLVSQAPPQPGCQASLSWEDLSLTLDVHPCHPGNNTLTISTQPQILELTLGFAQGDLPPVRRTLTPNRDGQFRLSGQELAAPGRWQIQVAALVNDFVQRRGTLELEIKE
ncbi:MAG: CopD family protein [Thermostichales cyanobacterium BF4_bins_65]